MGHHRPGVRTLEGAGCKAWPVWSTGSDRTWHVPPTWQIKAVNAMEGPDGPWMDTPRVVGPPQVLLKREELSWLP